MVNERTADGPPSLIDVLEACRVAQSYKVDADRWRRAHEIVEQERDQAREERDEAEQRYRDTAKALTEWHGRWVEMERERDQARESLHEACKVAQSYKVDAYQATERAEAAERELDEWKARAEAAESGDADWEEA